ncbi:hypothetical protein [Serratia marcescens]|nr:hypothetical protein [Serratia marcescens]AWO78927.1 hypothetical protein C1N78_10140 [Serratia marcescens]RFT82755.1 hypothetical protein DX900_05920 [Serratia marcescens]TFZ85256.1 hypothetical protein E4655_14945 [Serratia marcescens]
MTKKTISVLILSLFIGGCTTQTTDERMARAKAKYAESNPVAQAPSPLVRLECNTQAGTQITAMMNGASQTVTINSAVFRFVDRDDVQGIDTLSFARTVDGVTSWVFVNIASSDPVYLSIVSQKTVLKFMCSAYKG